eukprot:scaffold2420_cov259-Pinguiococcus_pyrenoidosus.AAC.4
MDTVTYCSQNSSTNEGSRCELSCFNELVSILRAESIPAEARNVGLLLDLTGNQKQTQEENDAGAGSPLALSSLLGQA